MKDRKSVLSPVFLVAAVVWLLLSCTCPSGIVVVVTATPGGGPPPPPTSPPPPPPTQPGGEGAVMITFTASRTAIQRGECATLKWEVQGGYSVELNGQSVSRSGQQQVCPQQTTTYVLAVDVGDKMERQEITITVTGAGAPAPTAKPAPTATTKPTPPPTKPPTAPPLTFTFSPKSGPAGSEVNLYLSAPAPQGTGVYYNGQPLPKKTSPDSKTLTATIPVGASSGYFELRWDGQSVKASEPFVVTITADLAVTDLYPDNMPQGSMWVRITNHGPGTVTNAEIQLSVSAVSTEYVGGAKSTLVQAPRSITINLAPGQTVAFDTRLKINTSQYWYQVTASIQVPFQDPNPGNNSYTETIPPPP